MNHSVDFVREPHGSVVGLRVPCDPDSIVAAGEHKHLCEKCGVCWKHSDEARHTSRSDFHTAHSCPNCGRFVNAKHNYNPSPEQQRRMIECLLREIFERGIH